jgi:hypothetical protein
MDKVDIQQILQLPGWQIKYSRELLILEAPDEGAADNLIEFGTDDLAISAMKFDCLAAIVRFPGCVDKPYRVPAAMAEKNTGIKMNSNNSQVNPNLLGADYVRIHEFLIEQRLAGNIVVVTSNITRDAQGRRTQTENPEAGRDICHHTNDLLLPSRACWDSKDWTGYNYRLSWRRDYDDFTRLNPEYLQLKELLARDGQVENFEYTLYRPDSCKCRYSTSYYLCRNYLGDEVRIGISRPEDWAIIWEPDQAVAASR